MHTQHADDQFVYVPVKNRYVTRVQAYVVRLDGEELEGEEGGPPTSPAAPPQASRTVIDESEGRIPVWPANLLRRIAASHVKSLAILQVLLDRMASEPGRVFEPDELATVAEQNGVERASMFNAIGKLHPHFRKHYGREDLPFVRDGEPGTFRYSMTPEQARAWEAVRS